MLRIIGTIISISATIGVIIIYGMIIYYQISGLIKERKKNKQNSPGNTTEV